MTSLSPACSTSVSSRSPYAHAKIVSIDTSAAREASGVSHVVTGRDLAAVCQPWTAQLTNLGEMKTAPQAALPTDIVHWQGEPVAAVVAGSRAVAEDAAELVEVDFAELPAVVDPEAALEPGSPLVHPGLETNVAWSINIDTGAVDEALAGSDVVVEKTFHVNRQTGVTLEPRGAIADYDPSKRYLTLYLTSQVPHIQRYIYAKQLGLNEANVRIICPDIGGGFGLKLHVYSDEIATAAISMLIRRPVKFVADRLESFVSDIHARGHRVKARLGVNNDGKIQALDVDDLAGAGPYLIHPRTSVIEPLLVAICTPLAYDLKHYRANAALVYQNKVSTGQYRGVGMPVASLVAEGLVDAAAKAIGMDKAEIRKRNLFKDDAYPVTGISGEYLECLSQQASLDKLLKMMDYDKLLEERDAARDKSVYKGIGLVTVVEGTSPGPGPVCRGRRADQLPGSMYFAPGSRRQYFLRNGVDRPGSGRRSRSYTDRRRRARRTDGRNQRRHGRYRNHTFRRRHLGVPGHGDCRRGVPAGGNRHAGEDPGSGSHGP